MASTSRDDNTCRGSHLIGVNTLNNHLKYPKMHLEERTKHTKLERGYGWKNQHRLHVISVQHGLLVLNNVPKYDSFCVLRKALEKK